MSPCLLATDRGTVLLSCRTAATERIIPGQESRRRSVSDRGTVLLSCRTAATERIIPGQENRRRSVELAGNVLARKENQTEEPSPCLPKRKPDRRTVPVSSRKLLAGRKNQTEEPSPCLRALLGKALSKRAFAHAGLSCGGARFVISFGITPAFAGDIVQEASIWTSLPPGN